MTNIRKRLKSIIKSEIEILILKIKIKKIQSTCNHQYRIIGIYPDYEGFEGKNLKVSKCIKCQKVKKKLS